MPGERRERKAPQVHSHPREVEEEEEVREKDKFVVELQFTLQVKCCNNFFDQ